MRSEQGTTGRLPERNRVVAIMQPYLYPYAGYFRLLAVADVFIILDDVQFPRRGRVHRCSVPSPTGEGAEWLTLPITRAPRELWIRDLAFADGAREELDARLCRFPWLARGAGPIAARVRSHLHGPLSTPCDFVEAGLALVADALGFEARRIRSSSLGLDRAGRRGQDYITALVRAVGGTTYVNAPGGRSLYDGEAFAAAGLTLRFLEPYTGRYGFLLPALMSEEASTLRAEIVETARCVP